MPAPRKRQRSLADAIYTLPVEHEPDLVRLWSLRLTYALNGLERARRASCQRFRMINVGKFLLGENWNDKLMNPDDDAGIARIRAAIKPLYAAAEKQHGKDKATGIIASNLRQLSALIGLSPIECTLLLFIVMMDRETLLEQACRTLDDLSMKETYHILAGTLALEVADVTAALSFKGKLARCGLINADKNNELELPDRFELISGTFSERLTSPISEPREFFADIVKCSAPPTLKQEHYQHIQLQYELARQYLRIAIRERRCGVNILIHGEPGTGKSEFARLLSSELNCLLMEVASQNEAGESIVGTSRLQAFKAAQSFFRQEKCMILFDEIQDIFDDGGLFARSTAQLRKAEINLLLEENSVPALWITNHVHCMDAAFVRRFDLVIDMIMPPLGQRVAHLEEAFQALDISAHDIRRLAEHNGLAPAIVQRSAHVIESVKSHWPDKNLTPALEAVLNNTLNAQGYAKIPARHANALPAYYDPRFVNADVDLAALAEGMADNPSARICLYGPPGTGKSAFGQWIARQLNKPLHSKRISDLVSKWVGETEQNISHAFEEAGRDHAVLLLDEVDSFLADRRHAQHSWESTQVNEMLTQMEAFNGLFIASTNLIDNLDDASLRRFDLKIKFHYMKPEQCAELFKLQCESLQMPVPDKSLLAKVSALTMLTPGDFATVARQHRFRRIESPSALLTALQQECALKSDTTARHIGFIH